MTLASRVLDVLATGPARPAEVHSALPLVLPEGARCPCIRTVSAVLAELVRSGQARKIEWGYYASGALPTFAESARQRSATRVSPIFPTRATKRRNTPSAATLSETAAAAVFGRATPTLLPRVSPGETPEGLELAVAERVLERERAIAAGKSSAPASWPDWEHGVAVGLEAKPSEVARILGRRSRRLRDETSPKTVDSFELTRRENQKRKTEREALAPAGTVSKGFLDALARVSK